MLGKRPRIVSKCNSEKFESQTELDKKMKSDTSESNESELAQIIHFQAELKRLQNLLKIGEIKIFAI